MIIYWKSFAAQSSEQEDKKKLFQPATITRKNSTFDLSREGRDGMDTVVGTRMTLSIGRQRRIYEWTGGPSTFLLLVSLVPHPCPVCSCHCGFKHITVRVHGYSAHVVQEDQRETGGGSEENAPTRDADFCSTMCLALEDEFYLTIL